jgi:signal transduction histidine kinase
LEGGKVRSHEDTFGLFSVAERLRLFGGQLYIDSAPNLGTRIQVIVAFDGPVTSTES